MLTCGLLVEKALADLRGLERRLERTPTRDEIRDYMERVDATPDNLRRYTAVIIALNWRAWELANELRDEEARTYSAHWIFYDGRALDTLHGEALRYYVGQRD